LAALLVALPALAVDGAIVNKTTGQPAGGTLVSLYKLGQGGMENLATVKTDAQGKFQIAKDAEGPRLLQIIFDNVVYSYMLPPGSPSSGIAVNVYNSSKKPVDVSEHFLFLQPSGEQLAVNEIFQFHNETNLTYNDGSTLRFFAPPGAEQITVRATAPGGMPVERPAEKTGDKGVYKVDFPVKPGDTRFDVSYRMPYSSGMEFSGRALYSGKAATLLLAPPGVTVEGPGLENKGQEPATQATIYAVKAPAFRTKISGEMSAAPAAESGGGGGPEIEQIAPKILERGTVILVLALGMLALGFVLLYRKPQKS